MIDPLIKMRRLAASAVLLALAATPCLAASSLSPDALGFVVYQPAEIVTFQPAPSGSQIFFLHYKVDLKGKGSQSGPYYSYSVQVFRVSSSAEATQMCERVFSLPMPKATRRRLPGYSCAFEQREDQVAWHYRSHWYAKCSYFVVLGESAGHMALPGQVPTAPLLAALDNAVAKLDPRDCDQGGIVIAALPPCSAATEAKYNDSLSRQRGFRPRPGSRSLMIENGKLCYVQAPAAPGETLPGPQPAPGGMVIVWRDGQTQIVPAAQAGPPAAPAFTPPSFVDQFDGVGLSPVLLSPQGTYVPGAIPLPPIQFPLPPGSAKAKYDPIAWMQNKIEAQINWARENKAETAIWAVSLAVSAFMPELPAVAALGPIGANTLSAFVAPATAAVTTAFVGNVTSGRGVGTAFARSGSALVKTFFQVLPESVGSGLGKQVAENVGAGTITSTLFETAGGTGGSFAPEILAGMLEHPGPATGGIIIKMPISPALRGREPLK